MSLYLKYRPTNFEELVGQDHIKVTLQNALKEDRTAHAYLFCGPRGTGKTSTARLLAKALNCLNPAENGNPCNSCDICEQINAGRLTDIIEIDAASNRGIDEIRDLREKIKFAPNIAKHKIYIIDEVHMLTKEAFNALLKTLEEPPAHAYFILATTESYKVPETIISRCQRFDFHRITDAVLVMQLAHIAKQEGVECEEEALKCIAERSMGGLRDAIGLLEQSVKGGALTLEHLNSTLGVAENQMVANLYGALTKRNVTGSLECINDLYSQGFDLMQTTKDLLEYARKAMIEAVHGGNVALTHHIIALIEEIETAKERIKNSSIPQLALEVAAIKLCTNGTVAQPAAVAKVATPNIAAPAQTVPASKTEPVATKEAKREAPAQAAPAAPTPASAPAPAATATPAAPTADSGDLLGLLRKNWNNLLSGIKNPAIRVSFKDAKVASVTDTHVVLYFSSQFHLDKTSTTTAHGELEALIEKNFSVKRTIKGEVRKIDLEPMVHERSHAGFETVPADAKNPAEEKEPSTVEESPEDAISVFDSW